MENSRMRRYALPLLVALTTVVVSAAGPDARYKAPRTENGHPDLQGVWNFSSDVPLQRPVSAGDKKVFTREELAALRANKLKAFETVSKLAPVEAVGLTWLDYEGKIENLRTSLITYPDTGRLPKLVDGVTRAIGPDEIITALSDPKAGLPPELAAFLAGGAKNGPEDFSAAERCLSGGSAPYVPDFDGNYVQVIQAKDHVVLRSERRLRIVPVDGRPHLTDKLRMWGGDSRGHWEGDTLVVETSNFNRRTFSFAGAGNSREKVVTERFTRVSKDALDYEATVVDPKTFQDKVVFLVPMARVDARIYESGCHEGNYSMSNMLSAARKVDQPATK
jgi:hypothetical protein